MDKKSIITPTKNGPYVVQNLDAVTESVGMPSKTEKETVALCRCGKSSTKPYCDGTHGKIDFDDSKHIDRVERKIDTYIGKKITIHDDRGICSHAGYCTDELPNVFRMGKEPWIDADAETVEKIIETIKKCPSGALSYEIDGVLHDSFSENEQVTITEDGPYYVSGSIKLKDDDAPTSDEHYALCRCGKSKNKPYCNGQHWYIKFKDDGLVKEESECNCSKELSYDNKYDTIKNLAKTAHSVHKSMRTEKLFAGLETILFKSAQLHQLPLPDDIEINTKTVIGKKSKHPLHLDMPFYVSHMSFGAISKEAKIALAKGSSIVNTAMCSGEGGMLAESRKAANIYIYELGTAQFSHDEKSIKQADAIEIKMGQAAKPGYGGSLPADKVSAEIAAIRGIAPSDDGITPSRMTGVDNINDLKDMVTWLRKITDGKPIGIKFAAGHIEEDLEAALYADPDFITVDCRGGATGSAPTFIKDNVSVSPVYAIRRARRFLDSKDSDVSLCATGGFRDSSDIAKGLALGADAIALATASMIAIGCIQSKICHTGRCPVGIATQDEDLRLLFSDKDALVGFENFYTATNKELKILASSNGKDDVHKLNTTDIMTDNADVAQFTDIEHI